MIIPDAFYFPLINFNDLTKLVRSLDEDNWKTPETIKRFGLISENKLKDIKIGETTKEEAIESTIIYLEKKSRRGAFIIIDNLANQIQARCIIVANRLTHGEDKESEENIMRIGLMFQRCAEIPKPKIFSEFSEAEAEKKLQTLANKALNGDKELLKRLQDLPYLNPRYKFKENK